MMQKIDVEASDVIRALGEQVAALAIENASLKCAQAKLIARIQSLEAQQKGEALDV